ncbi:MAG: sulfotransferase domain-containing protein [Chitinophagales bacterium]|nr:sulfotransferase domain-containing protein [Chitinophagales bacterium]MDW8393573.1 sulfotransferase domain-containing protein [Chitinophagales bacterium]
MRLARRCRPHRYLRSAASFMLPNFLCVGAQKAGTTTLDQILRQHPDIFLPRKVKETKFFVFADRYAKGAAWYEQEFFSEWNGQKAVGEVDPAMMFEEPAAGRIAETLGRNVKLIFLLRHPATRAYSHYLMSRRRGFETLSFQEALQAEPQRLQQDSDRRLQFSYLARGYYAGQIERFLKLFPRDHMLFLIMEEDLIRNRSLTFRRIQEFLDVPVRPLNLDIRRNEAADIRLPWLHRLMRGKGLIRSAASVLLPRSLRRRLQQAGERLNTAPSRTPQLSPQRAAELIEQYFLTDIKRLEQLIDRDLSCWYAPQS